MIDSCKGLYRLIKNLIVCERCLGGCVDSTVSGRPATMTIDDGRRSAIIFLVLFVLLFCQSNARVTTARGIHRGLQTRDNHQVIRGELIHRDHPRSPLCHHHNATMFERIEAATKRSLQRENHISSSRRQLAFQTPINAANSSLPGEYVMEIFLGTPLKRFIAIVDTGSDLVWVQCSPCITCFEQPDPYFDPTTSSSYVAVPCTDPACDGTVSYLPGITCQQTCHFEYNYLDKSSIAGFLSTETLFLSNTTSGAVTGPGFQSLYFGCMNNNTGLFTAVDGLVGFGMGPLSLPMQISGVERATFSYCLVSISAVTDFTSTLFFATPAATVNGLPLVYTPLVKNPYAPSFYFADMIAITVNGVDLQIPVANFQFDPAPLPSGGTLFDSGTVLTLLRTGVIEYVTTAVQAAVTATQLPPLTEVGLDLCYQVTAPPNVTMSFIFQGVDATPKEYVLDPYNIWLNVAQDQWCMAIRSSADQSIIGNIAQANHFIETDIVGGTIGWLSVDCLTSF